MTIDAMGTQTAIAEKIRSKRGEYVLALKENQKNLYEDIRLFLNEESEKRNSAKMGSIKKQWKRHMDRSKCLKSIGMEEKTIQKDGIERKEYRYYISSLKEDVELFSRAVRGHWSVESMHWHLDVTFKEDANTTLDKQAAENLNIIRKWCLSILKMVEIFRPNLSMKKKRFVISMNPAEFIEQVLIFLKDNFQK